MKFYTVDEYYKFVQNIAVDFLTTYDAKEWRRERPDDGFDEFLEEVEYSGLFHNTIDCHAAHSWKDAIQILTLTRQDADAVDSGLYEGCDWKRILAVIAYEVLSWDVQEKAEELFDSDFAEGFLGYQNSRIQLGYHPSTKRFIVPKGISVIDLGSCGIKIMLGNAPGCTSIVFDGDYVEKHGDYLIDARRVYTQNGDKGETVDAVLEKVKRFYGVREL